MKTIDTRIAAALSLALLVPLDAAAQEPSASLLPVQEPSASPLPTQEPLRGSLVSQDPVDDPRDPGTGRLSRVPGYTDLSRLEVSVDGETLRVRFDVAEPVPEAPDPLDTTVGFYLNIDTDADGSRDYHVAISSEEGWHINVFDYDAAVATRIGDAEVSHKSLSASVTLSELPLTPEPRFQGLMQAVHSPAPEVVIEWEDRVPDEEDAWLALAELSDEVATEEEARQPLRDLSAVVGKRPKAEFAEVKAQFLAYLDAHPATITTATNRDIPVERDHWWTRCEEELDRGRIEPDYHCIGAFQDLLIAYADTRDDDLYDLLGQFVGATVQEYKKGKQRKAYRSTLEKAVEFTPQDHPGLFED